MKRNLVVVSIMSVVVPLANVFAAPSLRPTTGKIRQGEAHPFYVCESNDNADPPLPRTYYLTQVIQPDVYSGTLHDEWQKFMEAKYGVPQNINMGQCNIWPDKQEAEQGRALMKGKITRNPPNQVRLIEVNWRDYPGSGQSSSAVSAQPTQSAESSGSAPAQSGSAQTSSAAPAAGTTLTVTMAEEVDSSKYSPGKQYHGIVTKPADGGNGITIPAGSMAIVTLSNGQSGWVAQLQSLTVKGQPMNVNSGPASVMSSAQSTAASAMNSVSSALSGFGFGKKNNPTAVEAIASGQRVILPPGTQLQFVLGGASP